MQKPLTNKSILPEVLNCQAAGELPRGETPRLTLSKELERTPGAVAVSGIYGRKLAGIESNVDTLPVSQVTLSLDDLGKNS